jgi:hypothetical protein
MHSKERTYSKSLDHNSCRLRKSNSYEIYENTRLLGRFGKLLSLSLFSEQTGRLKIATRACELLYANKFFN